MKLKNITRLTTLSALLASASITNAATVVYNGGSLYGGYADGPFETTFGALSLLDGAGTPAEVTTSIYDFRGLASSVTTNTTYFFLEDWQDGQSDSVGLTITGNQQARTNNGRNGSQNSGGNTDSVAEDSTATFGSFGLGSLRFNDTSTHTYTFDADDLGGLLPTYVGFALTESGRHVDSFIAYDSLGVAITGASIANSTNLTQDEFYGFQTDVGISRVEIAVSGGGELDHFQYGTVVVVPEPSTTALLGLGGLALILRRRK
jgi:hypothetical protein